MGGGTDCRVRSDTNTTYLVVHSDEDAENHRPVFAIPYPIYLVRNIGQQLEGGEILVSVPTHLYVNDPNVLASAPGLSPGPFRINPRGSRLEIPLLLDQRIV